ncbi:hypothetical protein C8J57DRAFT_1500033 [Mycena rebaudengoi]|nr:hypothetical protein C8J57DRAFT_1500033 [Mycena rebaudengoi]
MSNRDDTEQEVLQRTRVEFVFRRDRVDGLFSHFFLQRFQSHVFQFPFILPSTSQTPGRYDYNQQSNNQWQPNHAPMTAPRAPAFPFYDDHRYSTQQAYPVFPPLRSATAAPVHPSELRKLPSINTAPSYATPTYNATPNHNDRLLPHIPHSDPRSALNPQLMADDPRAVSPYCRGSSHASPPTAPPVSPTDEPTVKKKRKRADTAPLRVLNETYVRTAFPSTEERLALTKALEMSPRSVQIWFQNKRQSMWQTNRQSSTVHQSFSSSPDKHIIDEMDDYETAGSSGPQPLKCPRPCIAALEIRWDMGYNTTSQRYSGSKRKRTPAQKQHTAALASGSASTPSLTPSDAGKENELGSQLSKEKLRGDNYQREVYNGRKKLKRSHQAHADQATLLAETRHENGQLRATVGHLAAQVTSLAAESAVLRNELHRKVRVHLEKIIANPALITGPDMSFTTATLDGTPWEKPEVVLVVQYCQGRVESWGRFDTEWSEDGPISKLSPENIERAVRGTVVLLWKTRFQK